MYNNTMRESIDILASYYSKYIWTLLVKNLFLHVHVYNFLAILQSKCTKLLLNCINNFRTTASTFGKRSAIRFDKML